MARYLKLVRGLSRDVFLYILAWFFIGFAVFGVNGVLGNLYLLRLGYSPALVGQINGVGQLAWAAFALPASMLGMRFGMRNITALGTFIVGVFMILFYTAAYFPPGIQLPMTFLANIAISIGVSFSLVCGVPYISSVTSPEERSIAFSLNGAISTGAGVLGNITAGFLPGWMASISGANLDEALPFRLSLAISPVLLLTAAFLQSRMRADTVVKNDQENNKEKMSIPVGVFLFFGAVVFLQAASEGSLRAFFNIYLDNDLGVPTTAIGSLFGVGSLLSVAGAFIMPILVSRVGSRVSFCLVSIAAAAMLFVMGYFSSLTAASLSFISLGLIFSVGGAVRTVLSQEIVLPYWRSSTSAILTLGFALGWAIPALLGGWVINWFQFGGLMFISAGIAVLSAVLMVAYLAVTRTQKATAAPSVPKIRS